MTQQEVQLALTSEKEQFFDVALRPNTLERNVVLAGHRREIARLEKLSDNNKVAALNRAKR